MDKTTMKLQINTATKTIRVLEQTRIRDLYTFLRENFTNPEDWSLESYTKETPDTSKSTVWYGNYTNQKHIDELLDNQVKEKEFILTPAPPYPGVPLFAKWPPGPNGEAYVSRVDEPERVFPSEGDDVIGRNSSI